MSNTFCRPIHFHTLSYVGAVFTTIFFTSLEMMIKSKIHFCIPCANYVALVDAMLINMYDMEYASTDSFKKKSPRYNMRMYWMNFWQPFVHVQQNIFEKTLVEVGSSHLYASFGTFLRTNWSIIRGIVSIWKMCLKTVKSLFLKENVVHFEFFW